MSDTSIGNGGDVNALALPSTLRIGDVSEFKQECDARLAAAPDSEVTCDAAAVEFIDAAALQYLVALAGHCRAQHRKFTLLTPSAAFRNAVMVSGYATPLEIAAH